MNRGDRREAIYADDQDRRRFLDTLGEACQKTGWQIHACCLMPNHFHLVTETPQPNLAVGMKWLLGTYTARFNRRHKEFGHLFSGRYKALLVDGSGDGYLKTVCDYVHLNPARAGLISRSQELSEFEWNSYAQYLKKPKARWSWLRVDRLMGEHGIPKDSAGGRKEFEKRMEARRAQEDGAEFKGILRGWYLGSSGFREELLAQTHEQRKDHYGAELREADEFHAEKMVREELKRRGWKETELDKRRKGDAEKVEVAWRLRSETTMSLKWIAQRLRMGTWTHVSNCLSQKRKKKTR